MPPIQEELGLTITCGSGQDINFPRFRDTILISFTLRIVSPELVKSFLAQQFDKICDVHHRSMTKWFA